MDDESEAKLITAKLRALYGKEKEVFFDAVCKSGKANTFHFNNMIATRTSPADGEALLQRMELLGVPKDVVTYTSLIALEVFNHSSH